MGAHIDVPGVSNTLIASEEELHRHLQLYPHLELEDIIVGRVNHLSEMHSPEVRRARIWSKVGEVTRTLREQQAQSAPEVNSSPAPIQNADWGLRSWLIVRLRPACLAS